MNSSVEYIVADKTKVLVKKSTKNKYGQYFTPEIIADFMINLADINSPSKILEPSSGEGIFIKQLN